MFIKRMMNVYRGAQNNIKANAAPKIKPAFGFHRRRDV